MSSQAVVRQRNFPKPTCGASSQQYDRDWGHEVIAICGSAAPTMIAPCSSRRCTRGSSTVAMRSLYAVTPCTPAHHRESSVRASSCHSVQLTSTFQHLHELNPCFISAAHHTCVNGSPLTGVRSFTATGRPAAAGTRQNPDTPCTSKQHVQVRQTWQQACCSCTDAECQVMTAAVHHAPPDSFCRKVASCQLTKQVSPTWALRVPLLHKLLGLLLRSIPACDWHGIDDAICFLRTMPPAVT
jgi:hypothetical protein